MPRLCYLDGIVVWINTWDHEPPHFHARHGGDEIRVEIGSLNVMTGQSAHLGEATKAVALGRCPQHRACAKLVSSSPGPAPRANRPDHAGGLMAHPTVSVTAVELLGGHRVRLRFDDEATVVRDLFPFLWGPVFDKIRTDPQEFATMTVDPELGVLAWSNGADIDAELLRYDDLWNEALPVSRPA